MPETPVWADVLRRARERARLSQVEVGTRAGFSETYYGKVESGERRPSVEALFKIAEVLTLTERERKVALLAFADDQLSGRLREAIGGYLITRKPEDPAVADLPAPLAQLREHLWPDLHFEDLAGLPKGYLERHQERIAAYRAQLQALAEHVAAELAAHRKTLRAEYEEHRRKRLVDSPATQDQQIGELVEKMAKLNEEHWSKTPVPKDQWPGPTMLLGLPSTADGAGPRLWRVMLEHAQRTASELLPAQRGIWLEGAYFEVYTLLYGYHPVILDALAKISGSDVNTVIQKATQLGVLKPIDKLGSVPGMPIQDAVDLAVFLAKVQVEMDRFLPDTPSCGGPIDVMILQMAPDPGISFLPGKKLHHPGQTE